MEIKKIQFVMFCSVMCFLFCSMQIYSQTNGKITGKVKDKGTEDVLPGANVFLDDTAIGASTDLNGEYAILNVPPGAYTLKVTYIGYRPLSEEIQIVVGETFEKNFLLESEIVEGGEVEVSAQREGQVAAINKQLTADALVNVVSSEKILEVPDANAAESIARLPGVSIQRDGGEGSSVVIRGLSPKFSKITIDGIDVATTGTTTRSTNLSTISQENLKGIELFKAPTADMDGDAIGGTVNLQTAKASETPERIARVYGAYNSLEDDYEQYDIFGRLSQRLFDDRLGVQFSVNAEKRNRSADLFSGGYELQGGGNVGVQVTSASVTDRLEERKRQGGSLILDYAFENTSIMFTNFYSRTTRDILERRRQISVSNTNERLRIRQIERELQTLVNSIRGEHQAFGFKVDWAVAHSFSKSDRPYDHWIRFADDLNLSGLDARQNAVSYYGQAPVDSNAVIDFAQFQTETIKERNYSANLNFKYPFSLSKKLAGFVKFGGKFKHLDRKRNYQEGRLWAYLFTEWNTLTAQDFLDNSYTPNNFLNGEADLGLVLDAGRNRAFYNESIGTEQYVISPFYSYLGSLSSSARVPDYETDENIRAAYVMTKLNYGSLLTFIPGLRFESVDNTYFGHNFFNLVGNSPRPIGTDYFLNDTTATQTYNDLLPMIHLKIKPLNWFDLRLSATRTLSRPNFNFLIPVQSLSNFPDSQIYLGAPNLKPARAWNYDIYASVYQSRFGLLSVGYFYKSIDDISVLLTTRVTDEQIENGLPEFGVAPLQNSQHGIDNLYQSQNLELPINLQESTVQGLEVDLQTNFQFLPVPNFLKGIVLNLNYSKITSITFFPFFEVTTEVVVDPFPRLVNTYTSSLREGPVPGQVDDLFNLSVGYDLRGFSARLSLFYQTESIDEIGTQKELDRFTGDFTRWDISLRQRIGNNFDLFLNLINLTETRDNAFFFTKENDSSLEDFGRAFDFGFQVRL